METKIFYVSLGCSKNHCDLENMMGILKNAGYEIALDESDADVAIINTCGFIESAAEEAISTILEIAEQKKSGKLKALIVTGCLAQRHKEEILENFPEVDAVVGVFNFDEIDKIVKDSLNGVRSTYLDRTRLKTTKLPRIQATPFYTAYLKIAEGCDNRCTYCAIPKIRGKFTSRGIEELYEEARKLADNGVKELIVVAQDTTYYGVDLYGKPKLIELLKELLKIEEFSWIRLHYMYPEMISDELIEFIKSEDRILNYFDIPIQHINDRVLKLMNRKSDRKTIECVIGKIRTAIPDATIRTTVITGFPTETEEEFNELYEFIKEVKFDRLGAFAFSKEEGTPAYNIKGQVPKKVRVERQNKILSLQSEIMAENNLKEKGKIKEVLVEGFHGEYGVYFGRSRADSVDIDGTVMFECEKSVEFGEIVNIEITDALEYDLVGKMI